MLVPWNCVLLVSVWAAAVGAARSATGGWLLQMAGSCNCGLCKAAMRETLPQLRTYATAADHPQAGVPLLCVITLAVLVLLSTGQSCSRLAARFSPQTFEAPENSSSTGRCVWGSLRLHLLLLQGFPILVGTLSSAAQAPIAAPASHQNTAW